jgi:hypothetical protein
MNDASGIMILLKLVGLAIAGVVLVFGWFLSEKDK